MTKTALELLLVRPFFSDSSQSKATSLLPNTVFEAHGSIGESSASMTLSSDELLFGKSFSS